MTISPDFSNPTLLLLWGIVRLVEEETCRFSLIPRGDNVPVFRVLLEREQ
jgi:hypothetical protein